MEEQFQELVVPKLQANFIHHHVVKLSKSWELDFACPELKIGVELQGFGTGHISYQGMFRDTNKHNDLVLDGWFILFFMSAHLKDSPNDVIKIINQTVSIKSNGRITPRASASSNNNHTRPETEGNSLLLEKARRLLNQRFNK